jgi:tRNA(Arg) A34 adenosine deaminase TadA
MQNPPTYPPKPPSGPLNQLWDLPVKDLVLLPITPIPDEDKERHALYSLLLLALMASFWNGNKRGATGTYPWREKQKRPDGRGYIGGEYFGHNIAALGVDGRGQVIDFDFNHNYLFDSTVEHAESRLVRRIFSLVHLHDGWMTRDPDTPLPAKNMATFLTDVTVYTSLESCSQCAGIMTLGTVKDVVFLQRDHGQCSIGNILRNLGTRSGNSYLPPNPIPADLFGFPYFDRLEQGFAKFAAEVAQRPFWISDDGKTRDVSPSIASYLCTDDVLKIVTEAAATLQNLKAVNYPTYKPTKNGQPISGALTNGEVLEHVRKFRIYADTLGRRGTPHQM